MNKAALVRWVIVVAVVMTLAVPAEAKPGEGGRWLERRLDPIVKVIKRFVIRAMGDGLSDPRP